MLQAGCCTPSLQLGRSSAAALCDNAAHNLMGHVRPRGGMTLHLQNLHISQFKHPKWGPKLRTNVDSPSPPAQL